MNDLNFKNELFLLIFNLFNINQYFLKIMIKKINGKI